MKKQMSESRVAQLIMEELILEVSGRQVKSTNFRYFSLLINGDCLRILEVNWGLFPWNNGTKSDVFF